MFMRKPILPGTSDIDQLEKIWQLCGTPNQHTWPNFDALPGCEGVKRFQNYPKKLKSTFVRWVFDDVGSVIGHVLTFSALGRLQLYQHRPRDL